MQNFNFYNPTQIIFGEEGIQQVDEQIPENAKVLIIYGGESAKKNGTIAEVKKALGQRTVGEFSGIEPNPSYETLMQAVELIRSDDYDFLLAVGGGSVIDGTKFIAAAVNYLGEPWEILETRGTTVSQALPFGSVLTLPATGSEMNNGAVITKKETQTKLAFMSPYVYPKFSILDPTKTYTLPKKQLANGVVDAFVHVMEQYLTYKTNALVQDRFAEGLLQTLIEIGPKVLAEQIDYNIRANLMWTATLALNGLIGAGVPQDWATHMIGHEITAEYGIDHARTLAIILPANLDIRREAKRDKLLQYAERIWNVKEGTENDRIDTAIQLTRDFFESLGVPTRLADYELNQESISVLLTRLEKNGMIALGEKSDVTLETSRQILEASL